MFDIDSETPVRLTVVDDQVALERFNIYLDVDILLGQTSRHDSSLILGESQCGKDADECVRKGFSTGSFDIPSGKSYSPS